MSRRPKSRRKQYFIKKDYQFRFILKFCLIVLAGSVISTGFLLLFSRGTLTSSFEHSRLVIRDTAAAILPAVILTNAVTLIIVTLATIAAVLFISHKIAGPMFRFERDLEEIGDGDLTKEIRLRKKDQFMGLAGSLNAMTSSLREKVRATRAEIDQLLDLASEEKNPEKVVEGLNSIRENLDRNFKT